MVIGGTVTDDSTNEWVVLDQKVFATEFSFSLDLVSHSYLAVNDSSSSKGPHLQYKSI